MVRESQFQKAELKRLKQQWNERIETLHSEVKTLEATIEQLKAERKTRSAALQQQLFEQFRILNAKGDVKDLCELFNETEQKRLLPEQENALLQNSCNMLTCTS